MKMIVLAVAFIFALSALCFAFADERTVYILCNPKTPVIIRRSPKKGSEEIGRLDCGDYFRTDDKTKNGFIRVMGLTEYGEGWVFKGYVVDDEPVIDDCHATVAATGRVATRRYIRSKRTGWVNVCTDVDVYAYSELWAVTSKGYIKTKYLEMWHDE